MIPKVLLQTRWIRLSGIGYGMRRWSLSKLFLLFYRVAIWQPSPHIGACKDSNLSWWFYKYYSKENGYLVVRNRFGDVWYGFWKKIANIFRQKANNNVH